MGRTPCCEKKGLRKGTWSREEDETLATYIQKHGPGNWRNVPKRAGLLRCGKSCRFRWMNYLRPDVKRGNYSREEEEIIIKMHELYGNRWSMIAAALPGRTDNEIKNVWYTHLKNRPEKDGMTQKTSQVTQEEPEFNAETSWDFLSFSSDTDVIITPRSESGSCIPWCQQQSSCEFATISSNSSDSNVVIAENLIDDMREEFCKYGWPDISWSENSVMENEFLPIMFVDLYPQESFSDLSSIGSSSSNVVGQNNIGLSQTTEEFFENVWSKSFWTENSVMGVIDCQ